MNSEWLCQARSSSKESVRWIGRLRRKSMLVYKLGNYVGEAPMYELKVLGICILLRRNDEVILVSVLETGLPGIAQTAGSDHHFSICCPVSD